MAQIASVVLYPPRGFAKRIQSNRTFLRGESKMAKITQQFMTLLTGLLVAFSASAQTPPPPTELQLVMREMGANLGPIARTVTQDASAEANAALAEKLNAAIIKALALVPAKIAELPADQQRIATIGYQRLIVQLLDSALVLEESLRAKKLVEAEAAIKQMQQLQREGHIEFK